MDSIEQIAGLMLQPAATRRCRRQAGWFGGTYNGKEYEEAGRNPGNPDGPAKRFHHKSAWAPYH